MIKNIFLIFLAMIFLVSCGLLEKRIPVQYGVKDDKSAILIDRINERSELRRGQQFALLAQSLNNDLRIFTSSYAKSRLVNELAEIYSVNLLDIEKAIELDELLLREGIPEVDSNNSFVPQNEVASQRIIAGRKYFEEYIRVPSRDIRDRATERLAINQKMLEGTRGNNHSLYKKDKLVAHLAAVQNDVSHTHEGTPDRIRIMSRLLKAEYELSKVDKDFRIKTYTKIGSADLPFDKIDLTEIDFLTLSDYLFKAFHASSDIRYAQLALDALYRPYLNIRDSKIRWKYNKLINEFLSILIDESFKSRKYDDLLYYSSLNKSRMLLEERLAFSKNAGDVNVNAVVVSENIPRTTFGLPEKNWFRQLLAVSGPYLDLYVDGHYLPINSKSTKNSSLERSSMPLNSRDFGVENSVDQDEGFVDESLYITMVNNGRVISAKKISGTELLELKRKLSSSYQRIANGGKSNEIGGELLKSLRSELFIPAELVVSPDKWIAAHPLDFHLNAKVTRSVNFFMVSENQRLRALNVTGFFNPTLDLAGAEDEAAAIRKVVPTVQLFIRDAAQLSALENLQQASVLHLSMHGAFNSNDPKNSKLYFSGAKRGLNTNDPNALYARDMSKYSVLRERDLVFAAACQTGLSSADQVNENELMGILRPLTANRNRNVILSLWKVDDKATRDFVELFYQQLALTSDVRLSFHRAQDGIREKYKAPYYWAAFYLSQAR